jgi:hypothetical protein
VYVRRGPVETLSKTKSNAWPLSSGVAWLKVWKVHRRTWERGDHRSFGICSVRVPAVATELLYLVRLCFARWGQVLVPERFERLQIRRECVGDWVRREVSVRWKRSQGLSGRDLQTLIDRRNRCYRALIGVTYTSRPSLLTQSRIDQSKGESKPLPRAC